MFTLAEIQAYEQKVREDAVTSERDSAVDDALRWAMFFRNTHDELKAKLRVARGDERVTIQSRIQMVTRACDLFMLGLALTVHRQLPFAVAQIIRDEYPSKIGGLFAMILEDGIESNTEFLMYDAKLFEDVYVKQTRIPPLSP